jgi:regulatory ArsR family protein
VPDNGSNALIEHLVAKAFEGMKGEEKLQFVEKLFADLDPATQQEFLLKLTREVTDRTRERGAGRGRGRMGPPFMRRLLQEGPVGFAPWEACARMMASLAEAPYADAIQTAQPAQLFRALADETRLKIVKMLAEREMCVEELMGALRLAQATVSHHLLVLKEAGLVQADKRGRNVYYSLAQPLPEK